MPMPADGAMVAYLKKAGLYDAIALQVAKSSPDASSVHTPNAGSDEDEPEVTDGKKKPDPEEEAAEGEPITKDFGGTMVVTKVDTDKRQIFGWASISHLDEQPVIDKQGDIIPIEELQKAAHDFMLHSREQSDMHNKRNVGRQIEGKVYGPETDKINTIAKNDAGQKIWGWWVGFQVHDQQTWDGIKAGHRPELSIGGHATPHEVAKRDVAKYSDDEARDDHGRWTDSGGGETVSGYAPGLKANAQEDAGALKAEWAASSPLQTLDQVMGGAPENQAMLGAAGRDIAAETGAQFKDPGIKSNMARIQEKIDAGRTPAKVTDIVRAGFLVDSPAQADAVMQKLGAKFEVANEGWFKTEDGYFDAKALVHFPNGQIGEVQFWEPNMFTAKMTNGGHDLYVKARSLPPGHPDLPGLKSQMRGLYSDAASKMSPQWKSVIG